MSEYEAILQAATAYAETGRQLKASDKRAARLFRTKHGISEEATAVLLRKLGWSREEWDDGSRDGALRK